MFLILTSIRMDVKGMRVKYQNIFLLRITSNVQIGTEKNHVPNPTPIWAWRDYQNNFLLEIA